MPEDVYEVLSLGMRYWFVLLGALIVWRTFGWLRKDRREKHRRLRQLPDAGMIGELVVIVGSDELPEGTEIPVPREGVLGFLRTCDVVVPVSGVADQHLDFSFRNGKGLLLRPWRGCTCQIEADELTHRTNPARYPMHHGSRLFVGDAVLRLRVFAGLDVPRHVIYTEDEPESSFSQDPHCPSGDQQPPYAQPYWPPIQSYAPPRDIPPAAFQADPRFYQQPSAVYPQDELSHSYETDADTVPSFEQDAWLNTGYPHTVWADPSATEDFMADSSTAEADDGFVRSQPRLRRRRRFRNET